MTLQELCDRLSQVLGLTVVSRTEMDDYSTYEVLDAKTSTGWRVLEITVQKSDDWRVTSVDSKISLQGFNVILDNS